MLIDMHVHTSVGSNCCVVSLYETIYKLKEIGFSDMLITDHENDLGYKEYLFKRNDYPQDFLVL